MLLKSLVPGFSNPHTAWLALATASTLAGNLTITGSVANIIVVESARPDVHVSSGIISVPAPQSPRLRCWWDGHGWHGLSDSLHKHRN
jgi:hypothetical protein